MTSTTDKPDPYNEILAARMEVALHGWPRDRRRRRRLRELLGEGEAPRTDNNYDRLRHAMDRDIRRR